MPKPDYKKANEDLLKILESFPEADISSINNEIIDVTKESLEIAYQFTKNDLLVIKPLNKKIKSN